MRTSENAPFPTLGVRIVDQPAAGRRGRGVVQRSLEVRVRQTRDGVAHCFVAQTARPEGLTARRLGSDERQQEVLRAELWMTEIPGLLSRSGHEVKRDHRLEPELVVHFSSS
jgi:hypothetical protein